jgi:hypothetical protein
VLSTLDSEDHSIRYICIYHVRADTADVKVYIHTHMHSRQEVVHVKVQAQALYTEVPHFQTTIVRYKLIKQSR